ncbi:MAG: P-loop NTPase [Oscillospiraceae bacterium]|nr:P-loop NTPase [Oscillospiraceae bacterium]
MIKIAIYGKGGIGKSTCTANLAAALADMGRKVIQIGCDPKADSTMTLLGGENVIPVMEYLRTHEEPPADHSLISRRGHGGVLCIETGGPTPGMGCAGRGIVASFDLLGELRLFEREKPDAVLYDVLGDVVCGGFAVPIREGYADRVFIVTSGEKMSLYAADNICRAVDSFADRGYAKVGGIILNRRNIPDEEQKVLAFAEAHGTSVIADIPRSDDITACEDRGMTVIEGAPESPAAKAFAALARRIAET